MILLGTVFLVWYMNFADGTHQNPNTGEGHIEVRDRDYFFTPGFILFGMAIGMGLAGLLETVRETLAGRMKSLQTPIMAVLSLLAILGAAPLRANYFSCDRSRNYVPYDFAYNMLVSCEPNAILINGGDNDTFPIWCLQEVYGLRPDVTAINLSLANGDWYIKQVRDQMGVPLRWSDEQIGKLRYRVTSTRRMQRIQDQVFDEILAVNQWRRPINLSLTITDDCKQYMGRSIEPNLMVRGMVYKLVPGERPGSMDIPANHELYWNCFKFRFVADSTVYFDARAMDLIGNYATGLLLMADSLRRAGDYEGALAETERAIATIPGDYSSYGFLAQLYASMGREELIPGLVARVPHSQAAEIYFVWGLTSREKGERELARKIFKMTLDSFPTFSDAFKEYTRILYEDKEINLLRTTIETWLKNNPNDYQARQLLLDLSRERPNPAALPPPAGS